MKLPPYPHTKPSGVEWLGDVPEHWEVKRGRFVMRVNPPAPRLRVLKPEDEVSFVPMEALGVGGGINLDQTRVLAEVTSGYTEFQDGDVVVAKITPCFENGKAALACGLLNGAAYGTTELHVLRAKETLSRDFLFYVAISDTFRKLGESEMYGAGGQKRVPPEFAKDFRTSLPSPAEQQAIAAYLGRETGRLDRLVGRKRELIERLKEKRTALISRTVTRGLPPGAMKKYPQIKQIYADSKKEASEKNLRQSASICGSLPENPPLKPSGLDWLGDIPTHWEVVRLGRRIELQRGVDITKDEQSEGNVPVVSSGGISSFHDKAFARGPGVVVGRKGTAGAVHWVDCDYWPHDTTLYVREFGGNQPRYVFYKLCSMDLASFDTGSANPTLNRNLVHPVFVSWPPLPEQAAIAAYLDEETAKLDALVGKVEAAVERLQEYRTALITAAVTGKIDVRNAPGTASESNSHEN